MLKSVELLEQIAKEASRQRKTAVKFIHERQYGQAAVILNDLESMNEMMKSVLQKQEKSEAATKPRRRRRGIVVASSNLTSIKSICSAILSVLNRHGCGLSPKDISAQVQEDLKDILTVEDLARYGKSRCRLTARIYSSRVDLLHKGFITVNGAPGLSSLWEITADGKVQAEKEAREQQEAEVNLAIENIV